MNVLEKLLKNFRKPENKESSAVIEVEQPVKLKKARKQVVKPKAQKPKTVIVKTPKPDPIAAERKERHDQALARIEAIKARRNK